MTAMGADVHMFSPGTLMPQGMDRLGATISGSMEKCLENADVVMGLRIQRERQKAGLFPSVREYSKYYGIGPDELECAGPDALLMHPGPMHRGVERSTYAADCAQSVIAEQVQNGVAVRMALLYRLCRKDVG
jgi:aspartate carbamoyltransferase catalytic subunit